VLEKPEIAENDIRSCLEAGFGLPVETITFLPLGADQGTAVYRVLASDGRLYFLKLRHGDVNRASVEVPQYLYQQGMRQVIPSLKTVDGQLWASLGKFKAILYPFFDGKNGFEARMTPKQWEEFGRALKTFHATGIPHEIVDGLPREDFSPVWRRQVTGHLEAIERSSFKDPVSRGLAAFLNEKREATEELVKRAETLAIELQDNQPDFILCHGDIHGWNLFIDNTDDLYMVDWDTLIFAPVERDLMFVGGGLGNSGFTPDEEEIFFYQGYGVTPTNWVALAYYRYERVIEDIAVICNHVFLSENDGLDRQQAPGLLISNYLPGKTIDVARRTDRALNAEGLSDLNHSDR